MYDFRSDHMLESRGSCSYWPSLFIIVVINKFFIFSRCWLVSLVDAPAVVVLRIYTNFTHICFLCMSIFTEWEILSKQQQKLDTYHLQYNHLQIFTHTKFVDLTKSKKDDCSERNNSQNNHLLPVLSFSICHSQSYR